MRARRNPFVIQVNSKSITKLIKDYMILSCCFREPPAKSLQSRGKTGDQDDNLLFSCGLFLARTFLGFIFQPFEITYNYKKGIFAKRFVCLSARKQGLDHPDFLLLLLGLTAVPFAEFRPAVLESLCCLCLHVRLPSLHLFVDLHGKSFILFFLKLQKPCFLG